MIQLTRAAYTCTNRLMRNKWAICIDLGLILWSDSTSLSENSKIVWVHTGEKQALQESSWGSGRQVYHEPIMHAHGKGNQHPLGMYYQQVKEMIFPLCSALARHSWSAVPHGGLPSTREHSQWRATKVTERWEEAERAGTIQAGEEKKNQGRF